MDFINNGERLIAPCGINCSRCYAFQRNKNRCEGCRNDNLQQVNHDRICKIKNCEFLAETTSNFCSDCLKFPCVRIRQLDKRYRKYNTTIIDDLITIKRIGPQLFYQSEKKTLHMSLLWGTALYASQILFAMW